MVKVTKKAAEEIKNILEKENKLGYGLRIFIAGASCGGPHYGLALEEKPGEGDKVIESNDVKIFLDEKTAYYLEDVELDYIETPEGSWFSLSNPNVDSACGSGCNSCY
jgi:iron-sulfur cluster assembly accessory protein